MRQRIEEQLKVLYTLRAQLQQEEEESPEAVPGGEKTGPPAHGEKENSRTLTGNHGKSEKIAAHGAPREASGHLLKSVSVSSFNEASRHLGPTPGLAKNILSFIIGSLNINSLSSV